MIILGIETSCDETAAAIVQDGTILLSNVIASSQEMYAKYGGIIPDKAAREQLKSIIPVVHEAIDRVRSSEFIVHSGTTTNYQLTTNNSPSFIDAIAVTVGPGLIGSLLIGVETAKALAYSLNKPLIPVNHLVGHLYANWIQSSELLVHSSEKSGYQLLTTNYEPPQFPAVALLVSGGHSDLVLMTDHGKFTHLGSTRDDAAGECFDKCGRLLGLPYPYGPYIEAEASKFKVKNSKLKIVLPRPMINSKDFDFSFSGLKTAFLNKYNGLRTMNYELITPHLAYVLQEAVTDVLVTKTVRAVEKYRPKSVLLAGGVAANSRLRDKLSSELTANRYPLSALHIPPLKLCTDNAAYIASAAYFLNKPVRWEEVNADAGLTIMG